MLCTDDDGVVAGENEVDDDDLAERKQRRIEFGIHAMRAGRSTRVP